MINLTADELKDILEALKWIEDSPDWRNPFGWNDELYLKIHNIISPPVKCALCGSLEEHWNSPNTCDHDFQPSSVSSWGHQFNQCVLCGEVE